MLRDGPTEPMIQRGASISLPGAVRAAQIVQAQTNVQETMKTLADQLLVLFDEIPYAGRTGQERRAMHQHVQSYFRIADGVWETQAADQLHDLISNRTYTVAADTLEQKLIQIHEACQQTRQDPKARGNWFWRRRVRLYSHSLLEWKRSLDAGPSGVLADATTCGRVLYRAHGRVGLAGISGFEYLLVMSLPILGILASLVLTFIYGAMNVVQGIQGGALVPTVLSSLIALYILWFSTAGPAPLPLIVGYALGRRQPGMFTKTLRPNAIAAELKPVAPRLILRALLTILGTLLLAGLITLLALSVYIGRDFFLNPHSQSASGTDGSMTTLLQNIIGQPLPFAPSFTNILLPVLCLGSIALFYLPFTLGVQTRMTSALLAHPERSPEARRYALRPALELLSFHSITLFLIVILANSFLGVGAVSILPSSLPYVSWRFIVYAAALVLPYLLLIDLPYRQGMARWRLARLHDLALRRNEIAQRLSHIALQTAEQIDLRTVQDYLTWQYYRTQESEIKETSAAPFPIERRSLALILAILSGLALDWLNSFLHSLL